MQIILMPVILGVHMMQRGHHDMGGLDAGKVERMKWLNEILHRATAKVWVLRLKTHQWSEEVFGALLQGYVGLCEGIKVDVLAAVNRSYRAVAGEDSGTSCAVVD